MTKSKEDILQLRADVNRLLEERDAAAKEESLMADQCKATEARLKELKKSLAETVAEAQTSLIAT